MESQTAVRSTRFYNRLYRVNWVQNAAARLVLGLQPRDHIKPALFELHWLPVHLRIDYKLCLLMHSATVQCCPIYISDIVHTTAASSRRQGLRSSTDTFSYNSSTDLHQVWRTRVFSGWSIGLELSASRHSAHYRHL